MKFIIVFVGIFVFALAHEDSPTTEKVTVVSQTDERDVETESYKYSYVLSDGQVKAERHIGWRDGEYVNRTKGLYSWTAPDGSQWSVLYEADDDGYRPQVIKGPLPEGALESIINDD